MSSYRMDDNCDYLACHILEAIILIARQTYAKQNTDKALIAPSGVDWMNFTAEYFSFCLTFVRNVLSCFHLKWSYAPTVYYLWHLAGQQEILQKN